jgi:hypothetical protein
METDLFVPGTGHLFWLDKMCTFIGSAAVNFAESAAVRSETAWISDVNLSNQLSLEIQGLHYDAGE